MTKAIAEGEIMTYGKGLPIGVIRPSMSKYNIEITYNVIRFYFILGILLSACSNNYNNSNN